MSIRRGLNVRPFRDHRIEILSQLEYDERHTRSWVRVRGFLGRWVWNSYGMGFIDMPAYPYCVVDCKSVIVRASVKGTSH